MEKKKRLFARRVRTNALPQHEGSTIQGLTDNRVHEHHVPTVSAFKPQSTPMKKRRRHFVIVAPPESCYRTRQERRDQRRKTRENETKRGHFCPRGRAVGEGEVGYVAERGGGWKALGRVLSGAYSVLNEVLQSGGALLAYSPN